MSERPELPGMPEAGHASVSAPVRLGAMRIARPERHQIELVPRALDDLLAEDHPARVIWALLERVDLDAFYAKVRAVIDGPGRPASDPRVLLGLWVLATVEGIGSARWLARLTTEHDAYRWLRGRVPVNYHTLSDFRVSHQQELNDLMTKLVATLRHQGPSLRSRTGFGDADSGGAGWDAGARECWRGLVSAPAEFGAVSDRSARAGRAVGQGARAARSTGECARASGADTRGDRAAGADRGCAGRIASA